MKTEPDSPQSGRSESDLPVFAWFFALAVLFQLARGDMGLFPALRSTPDGTSNGDGLVPQVWFCCALVTLARPRVWSLVLVAAVGAFDFWWRLPIVTPSIYFHGLLSAQVLLTAAHRVLARKELRVPPGEFMESFRPAALGLLVVLFFFAVFHKFTSTAVGWTAGFFHLLAKYYLPFAPTERIPDIAHWAITVAGESVILASLCFPRTRPVALVLCIGFSCVVGTIVYGFGSIVLAASISLGGTDRLFDPLVQLRASSLLRERITSQAWRLAFVGAIAAIFLLDHARGFTLADRPWLFEVGRSPATKDVLTLMQVAWFVVSTVVLVSTVAAWWKRRDAIAARWRPARNWATCALPAFFVLSEAGIYFGVKDAPNVAMFSGLRVASRAPNHIIVRRRLLLSCFHRDLLLVKPSDQDERIGIPPLSLLARQERAWRVGVTDSLVEAYRQGEVTRLRGGVEQPFDLRDLAGVRASSWPEAMLPRRLFRLDAATESDLRASMPDLFVRADSLPACRAAGQLSK